MPIDMNKSQVIAILFDGNSENIFRAGQLVTGHVHVSTAKRIKIRGIRIEMTGKAETSWTQREGEHSTRYDGKETYMCLEICLIGSRSHDSEMYLEPSVHKYPFSFILPPELPASFEGKHGHIRYKAKAVIDRPMRIDDKAEISFTVIHLLDLNEEPPFLREPRVIQSEKPPSDCCCAGGFLEVNATLSRGCFVPGETIHIEGAIANRTNTSIYRLTITFLQNTIYCATKKNGEVYNTTCSRTTLGKSKRPPLECDQTDSWNDISFVVPQVVPSRLEGCGIMYINYYIEILAILEYCSCECAVYSAIVIGNVPLCSDFQPSVVTSQPMGFPMPYSMSAGCKPPATSAPTEGSDKAGVKTWKHDGKDIDVL